MNYDPKSQRRAGPESKEEEEVQTISSINHNDDEL